MHGFLLGFQSLVMSDVFLADVLTIQESVSGLTPAKLRLLRVNSCKVCVLTVVKVNFGSELDFGQKYLASP